MFNTYTRVLSSSPSIGSKQHSLRIRRNAQPRTVRWSVVVACAAFVMGCVHVLTLNRHATRGYTLRQLESNKALLTQDVRLLDSRIGELTSIGVIETAARSMEFVAVDNVKYYVADTGVAAAGGGQQP